MLKLKIMKLLHIISKDTYKKKRDIEIIKQSSLFNEKWYYEKYPDVKNQNANAAKHYALFGWKEGRNPSSNFDSFLYLSQNPDVKQRNINPLVHYERFGRAEGRHNTAQKTTTVPQPNKAVLEKKAHKDYFFSIIVASYNYQDLIQETLDSLINQTYKNFEVIVVDDGSKDNSVDVIKKYIDKYPFIHLYQHENGINKGLPETVALGVKKAKGEYIAFCESDDYWTTDHLEEINKKINSENNVQIIVNDVKTFGDKNRCTEMQKVINLRKKIILEQKGVISELQFQQSNYIMTFSACCVHKSLLKTCIFIDVPKKTALDWWLWRQCCYKNRIHYLDKKITYWRLSNTKDIAAETKKQNEFVKKLDKIMEKRSYESVFQNNKKLSDIDDFSILELNKNKGKIIEKIKNNDVKGLKVCYISTTSQTNRPIGDGSTRYRCYHPAEVLSKNGAFVTVVPHDVFLKSLSYHYDVYIFHRPNMAELKIIKALKKLGKFLIADYDDLIFGNQKIAEQSSIFKNLNRPLEAVTQQFLNNMQMLLQFDYISVSTESLKKEVERIYPDAKVFVVHNFIPNSIIQLSNKMKARLKPKDKNLLMYCTGTLSHNADFKEIEETLLTCLEKDEKLKLFIFGVLSASDKILKSSRVFFHNVADYWDLFSHMSVSAFTIAPLEANSRFNECKSNVKFLESSVAGATLFATPIGDMKRVKDAGIQLCQTTKDWEQTILNRQDIDISKNIQNNFDYIVQNCSENTFLCEFKSIFDNMEV